MLRPDSEKPMICLHVPKNRSIIPSAPWSVNEIGDFTQMEEAAAKEKERKEARQSGIATAGVAQDKPKKKKDE